MIYGSRRLVPLWSMAGQTFEPTQSATPLASDRIASIELGPEADWFRVGAAPAVDIARRGVLKRVLLALVHAHLSAPRRSLSTEELVHNVWPGDRSAHVSARNRLYFAINALREIGLRDFIVRVDGGYALTRGAVVRAQPNARSQNQ